MMHCLFLCVSTDFICTFTFYKKLLFTVLLNLQLKFIFYTLHTDPNDLSVFCSVLMHLIAVF